MPRALIIGSAGQDGRYLSQFLAGKGYWLAGADQTERSDSAKLIDTHFTIDLRDPSLIQSTIDKSAPDEIYYLAAQNFSSEDERLRTAPVADVLTVNLTGAAVALSWIVSRYPSCRFFYAGSCHVFGRPLHSPQNEETPHHPTSPYGISKSAGLRLCRYFRESCSVFAVGGILFNHESPLRTPPFISARIAQAAARAASGIGSKLDVHDLDAIVDWGAASDYVEAMWLTLARPRADEYVIATGTAHTVRDFAQVAFAHVGKSWEDWVVSSRRESIDQQVPYVGDSAKLRRDTRWHPRTTFEELVGSMVDAYAQQPVRP
jgi:GDPmannose 4,6-dehydratase